MSTFFFQSYVGKERRMKQTAESFRKQLGKLENTNRMKEQVRNSNQRQVEDSMNKIKIGQRAC